jgi:hypothetical protein
LNPQRQLTALQLVRWAIPAKVLAVPDLVLAVNCRRHNREPRRVIPYPRHPPAFLLIWPNARISSKSDLRSGVRGVRKRAYWQRIFTAGIPEGVNTRIVTPQRGALCCGPAKPMIKLMSAVASRGKRRRSVGALRSRKNFIPTKCGRCISPRVIMTITSCALRQVVAVLNTEPASRIWLLWAKLVNPLLPRRQFDA